MSRIVVNHIFLKKLILQVDIYLFSKLSSIQLTTAVTVSYHGANIPCTVTEVAELAYHVLLQSQHTVYCHKANIQCTVTEL